MLITHAQLTIIAATIRATATGLTPVTLDEIRLLTLATRRCLHDLAHTLAWSHWRRQHQHRAQQAPYRRRGDPPAEPQLRL